MATPYLLVPDQGEPERAGLLCLWSFFPPYEANRLPPRQNFHSFGICAVQRRDSKSGFVLVIRVVYDDSRNDFFAYFDAGHFFDRLAANKWPRSVKIILKLVIV